MKAQEATAPKVGDTYKDVSASQVAEAEQNNLDVATGDIVTVLGDGAASDDIEDGTVKLEAVQDDIKTQADPHASPAARAAAAADADVNIRAADADIAQDVSANSASRAQDENDLEKASKDALDREQAQEKEIADNEARAEAAKKSKAAEEEAADSTTDAKGEEFEL